MGRYVVDIDKYATLARQTAAEGCVLVKNENQTLPLRKGDKVAVFGRMAFHYYKSGLGSGGLVNTKYVVGILDALRKENDISLDENLLQVYKNMDSDYASVKDRLQNDALIEKFLIKFLADESYANILKNLEAQNLEEAFRAAHTLKGVCQNLGLDRLYKSSYDVTEALRNGKNDVTSEMMEKLESDYDITVSSIRELQ